jgi:hypothetical protein
MSAARTFRTIPFGRPGVSQRSLGIPAAAYPGRIATASDLIVAVDRQQTALLLPMGASDTSMTVIDPSTIGAYSLLSIENEIVKTTGPPAGNVIPVSRGFDGTTPAVHQANALISGLIDAYHHNSLVAEVEAIETFLGPNGSNLPSTPIPFQMPIPFTPQTPGGALVVGSNAITLSPVPQGVNGSDLNHYLYISGGAGTAEGALITGGSAVAGAPSGQVIVTCAYTHSGAWTIQSASSGIKEAIVKAGAAGGVYIPSGTRNIYAPLINESCTSMWGDGPTSIIQQQFIGNGILIGPNSPSGGNVVSIRNLRAVYGLGVGAFATSGSLWTFQNVTDGFVEGLDSLLGYTGFNFNGSTRVKYTGLYSNSNNIAYLFRSSGSLANAGQISNFYGTVQTGGILIVIYPTIAGLSLSNFLLETGQTGTSGISIQQTGAGPINELQVSNGNVDNCDLNALALVYSATTGQSQGSTPMFSNIRFTNAPTSTQPVANLAYPLFGFKFSNCTFYNAGTGGAVVISGARLSEWTGNHLSVANAGGVVLIVQAGSGGEINSDNLFVGNSIGYNGAAPTNAISTDAAAHAGNRFVGNKINGAINWAATGSNFFDDSNQGLPVPSIAAAATITIGPFPVYIITGNAAAIATINGSAQGQSVSLIFTSATPAGVAAGGNIARAQTAVQNQAIRLTLNGGVWY